MEKPITSLAVVRGQQGVTITEGGGFICDGPAAVNLYRLRMIKMGLEAEMMGMRLTRHAPSCFKIIAEEHGIKAKRNAAGKREAYLKFCEMHGFKPRG